MNNYWFIINYQILLFRYTEIGYCCCFLSINEWNIQAESIAQLKLYSSRPIILQIFYTITIIVNTMKLYNQRYNISYSKILYHLNEKLRMVLVSIRIAQRWKEKNNTRKLRISNRKVLSTIWPWNYSTSRNNM